VLHNEGDDHRPKLACGKMALDHNRDRLDPERSMGRDEFDNHNTQDPDRNMSFDKPDNRKTGLDFDAKLN
jgi:hypothetical protein